MELNWAARLLLESPAYADCEELGCLDFYRAIFSGSTSYLSYGLDMEIPLTYSEGGPDQEGTWRSEKLREIPGIVADRNDAYLSACTYFPKRVKGFDGSYRWVSTNSKDTANELCAFVLDIDRCNLITYRNYVNRLWPSNKVPCPTYVVASGHGVHLFYVLEWPVAMKKRWIKELEHIQRWLADFYAGNNPPLGSVDSPRGDGGQGKYEETHLGDYDSLGLTHPYRVVGSQTKDWSDIATAWRIGDTWDIDELAALSGLPQRFDESTFDMGSSLLAIEGQERKQARERAAEMATSKRKSGKKGHNPVFYQWFLKEALSNAPWPQYIGGRYNTIKCLVLAARKDNLSPRQTDPVTREQIEEAARELYEIWNATAERERRPGITWKEIKKAIKSGYRFDGRLTRIRKVYFADECKWKIKSNQTRNYATQAEHLEALIELKHMRAKRKPSCLGGRPVGSGTKKDAILVYAAEHPDANHSEIARALGMSRTTVIKWLKDVS